MCFLSVQCRSLSCCCRVLSLSLGILHLWSGIVHLEGMFCLVGSYSFFCVMGLVFFVFINVLLWLAIICFVFGMQL